MVLLAEVVEVRFRASDPVRLLNVGREALQRTDWGYAQRLADRLVIQGDRDHGRLLNGEILYRQKKFVSAVEALNRLRDQGSLRVQAALIQGLCFLELENPRGAETAFLFVLEQRPDDVDALRGLASIAYDQGMWLHAERHLLRLTELLPHDGRPHWTLGIINRDMSTWSVAEYHLREALARDLPGAAPLSARSDLAHVLAEQKKYADALAETESIDPAERTAAIWQIRADCLRSLNRLTEAEREARRGVERFPEHAELLAEWGLIQLDQMRTSEALRALEQSLRIDPHMVRARQGLVRAYQSLGRTEDAVAQQQKITETEGYFKQLTDLTDQAMKKPWDASVRIQLSQVCRKLNKMELARVWAMAAAACEQQ